MIYIEHEILVYLINKRGWTTSIELASRFGVSIRTIKTTVKSINLTSQGIITSSSKGYHVSDETKALNILNLNQSDTYPQTHEERKKFIYKRFLLSNAEVSISNLADELSISESTLLNEINRIKPDLAEFDLHFCIKNDQLSITGYIENKKSMFSRFIYDETKESFLSINAMRKYLPHFDLELVKTIVTSSLDESHHFIDDFSLFNFVLHIGIILERYYQFPNNSQNELLFVSKVNIPCYVEEIIKNVTNKISHIFNIIFQPQDKYDLGLLIMTRISPLQNNQNLPEGFENIIHKKTMDLLNIIQKKTLETYGIDMNKGEFISRFLLHLNNLLTRLQNKIILRNPQMDLIKNMFPFIYDVSVYISNIIIQTTHLDMFEDEISYIALHIGVLIEETKINKSKVNVLLIYPSYFSQKKSLVETINNSFSEMLVIQDVVSSYSSVSNLSNYDLIITTLPITEVTLAPVIQVSTFLSPLDIGKIYEYIDITLKRRLRKKIEVNLNRLFNQNIFFADTFEWSQRKAIDTLSESLHANGYTNSEFKAKIYERELLSPSDYSNIAMPHPIEGFSLHSGIAVSLHPEGLTWNQKTVYIVFMLAIKPDDHLIFRDIFDFITDIIIKPAQLMKLATVKNFDEFIETFLSFI